MHGPFRPKESGLALSLLRGAGLELIDDEGRWGSGMQDETELLNAEKVLLLACGPDCDATRCFDYNSPSD